MGAHFVYIWIMYFYDLKQSSFIYWERISLNYNNLIFYFSYFIVVLFSNKFFRVVYFKIAIHIGINHARRCLLSSFLFSPFIYLFVSLLCNLYIYFQSLSNIVINFKILFIYFLPIWWWIDVQERVKMRTPNNTEFTVGPSNSFCKNIYNYRIL